MNIHIESVLYTDPQDAVPGGFCEKCGGALYLPSLECIRCQKYGL